VDQQGVDLAAALVDPAGAQILEADRLINDHGPELVMAVAEKAGDHTLVLRGLEPGKPGYYEVRIEALRPASAADRRSTAAYRSFTGAEGLKDEEAMARWTGALATWRELGEAALEGEVLARMGRQRYNQAASQPAAELYRQSAAAFARAGNPRWEAIARTNLGVVLLDQGEVQEAVDQCTRALPLARRAGDRLTQAKALQILGQAFQSQGELQKALDFQGKALKLFPPDDHSLRPHTLHGLGVLYARYFNDKQRGRELLLDARKAWGPGAQAWEAITLNQLGRISFEEGRLEEARRF
jgi:tetratricopeptide (TPR) repeat protein